jgi:hypothetical protein
MSEHPMSRRRPVRLAAAGVAVVLGGVLAGCGDDPDQPSTEVVVDSETATFEYVIPAGAGEALDAGTPLEILPAELEVNVGDTIRIENQDDRGTPSARSSWEPTRRSRNGSPRPASSRVSAPSIRAVNSSSS